MKIISWKIQLTINDCGSSAESWIFKNIFSLLFKRRLYKEFRNHSLIFGKEYLQYKIEDATIWHVSYERLSHLEVPINSTCGFTMQHNCLVYIHTNDNDKYSLPHNFTDTMIEEIKVEIEKSKI